MVSVIDKRYPYISNNFAMTTPKDNNEFVKKIRFKNVKMKKDQHITKL